MSHSWEYLKQIIHRIEEIEESISERREDLKESYKEASGAGFDVKTIKAIVKLRKQDPDSVAEQESLIDTYRNALGMA